MSKEDRNRLDAEMMQYARLRDAYRRMGMAKEAASFHAKGQAIYDLLKHSNRNRYTPADAI